MTGPVVWHELTAEDPVAALQFYKALFDWDVVATHQMGGDVGTYYLFGKGTTQMGGVFTRLKSLPPTWPRWLVYLAVPGVTAAVAAALAAGGQLLNGPNEVPGGSWIAQLIDAHGVPLAVHGPKEAAEPTAKPAAKPKAKAKPKAAAPAPAPEPAPKAVAKPKTKTKSKPKPKTKTKARPKVEVKAKSKSATKSKAKPKPKAKAKAKAKPKVKTRPQPKRTAAPKTKLKAKAKQKGKTARKAPRRGK
jgi:predicted enzyme related to lactoylglutathione lyase